MLLFPFINPFIGERQKEHRLKEITGHPLEEEVGDQLNGLKYSRELNDQLGEFGAIETIDLSHSNSTSIPEAGDILPQITSDLWASNVDCWTTDTSNAETIDLASSGSKPADTQVLGKNGSLFDPADYSLPETFDYSWLPATSLGLLDTSTKVAYAAITPSECHVPPTSSDRTSEVSANS